MQELTIGHRASRLVRIRIRRLNKNNQEPQLRRAGSLAMAACLRGNPALRFQHHFAVCCAHYKSSTNNSCLFVGS